MNMKTSENELDILNISENLMMQKTIFEKKKFLKHKLLWLF